MLFNSVEFILFFPIVTFLYFALPYRARVYLLVAASCIFYMMFIPRYLLILILVILIDYVAGRLIEPARGWQRRSWLCVSLIANIGLLALFKYYNFFNANLTWVTGKMGWDCSLPVFTWVLPLGLSFHTFQAMSYTIEVYRGKQPAERSLVHYSLYVLFYPQLVAGPIERPQNLLHQFREEHPFCYHSATSGLALMAWGMFKKVVIADRLSLLIEPVFREPGQYDGVAFAAAAVFFAFQIYCDFSGYSDIALGAAEVMGFRLMKNFHRPYFAQSLGDFWRRWHISLSTWFKDYLYVPLGGSRVRPARQYLNLLLVFLISGLWHGAQWTFIIWGLLHGFGRAMELTMERFNVRPLQWLGLERWPSLCRALRSACVFALVTLGWIFFRAATAADACYMISHLGTGWGSLRHPAFVVKLTMLASGRELLLCFVLLLFLLAVEAVQEGGLFPDCLRPRYRPLRWVLYYGLLAGILVLGVFQNNQFVYFQF